MKSNSVYAVLLILLLTLTAESTALRVVKPMSPQLARKMGVKLTTSRHPQGQIGVQLEFPPAAFSRFHHAELSITSGTQQLVTATLQPNEHTSQTVRLYFSVAPELLPDTAVTIFGGGNEIGPDGHRLSLKDFATPPPQTP